MEHKTTPAPSNQGRNVKPFREMSGIKQEVLADQLGRLVAEEDLAARS